MTTDETTWPSNFVPVATASGRKVHAIVIEGIWSQRAERGMTPVICCLVRADTPLIVVEPGDRRPVCRTCASEIEQYPGIVARAEETSLDVVLAEIRMMRQRVRSSSVRAAAMRAELPPDPFGDDDREY